MNSEELASKIVKILDSKKGMDIAGIDIRQLTTIGDYFILVTGTSSPHVKALAEEVVKLAEDKSQDHFQFVYDTEDTIENKLNAIATKVYRADGVTIAPAAKKQIQQLTELGFDKMPICMAKTQFSFSDDQSKIGAPRGFKVTIREVKVNAGAGFLVAKTGDIMTMPGLPKVPAAERIDIDENGVISGLF